MGESSDRLVVAEIGSSTTKAILVRIGAGGSRIEALAEAPTTAEPPELDVTLGVMEAVKRLEAETGQSLRGRNRLNVRLLCSSGDAGSGLQMMVAGAVKNITAESASRAALGAGARVMDVFSVDDGRPGYVKIQRIRDLKPDMVLLAGGTDGGAVSQVMDLADAINRSEVEPRFGRGFKLPVIFAGNAEIREEVSGALDADRYATRSVDNVRPVLELENLGPAKEAIYDSYMEHVIVHSPGYDKLKRMVEGRILPSQAAVGKALYAYAENRGINLLALDVGSATTDVYSVYGGVFNRSLNAEVGLTYGILNVLKEAGLESVSRWLPPDLGEREIRNTAANMMALQPRELSPTEKAIRDAAAREAIRLSVELHKGIASRLKGIQVSRGVADILSQRLEETHLDMAKTRAVVARGEAFEGSEEASALILLDALEPVGVTELLHDPEMLSSHAGLLIDFDREAGLSLLNGRILKPLGTCVAPLGRTESGGAVSVKLTRSMGPTTSEVIPSGEVKAIPLKAGEMAKLEVEPSRRLDLGRGKGRAVEAVVSGGVVGVVVDTRGRPLPPPQRGRQLELLRALSAGRGGEAS